MLRREKKTIRLNTWIETFDDCTIVESIQSQHISNEMLISKFTQIFWALSKPLYVEQIGFKKANEPKK